jgi:hypothetical protein
MVRLRLKTVYSKPLPWNSEDRSIEIVSAVFDQDFEKAATLATIGDTLTPFRSLCRISTSDASENKEHP